MPLFNYVSGAKKRIDEAVDGMMRQMGEAALAEARRLVPVDTGHLKSSLGYVYRQSDKTIQLYADAPYAGVIEFGSATHRAQPYLRPALLSLRGFKLGANFEIGFQNSAGAVPPHNTSEKNAAINSKLNRGIIRRTRVRVRQYKRPGING